MSRSIRLLRCLLGLLALGALLVACEDVLSDSGDGAGIPPRPIQALPPTSLAADSGSDSADHACQVVLREVGRAPHGEGFAQVCTDGTCHYVWQGVIDVAESLPPDVSVHLLFHLVTDPGWWEIAAPAADAVQGYRRHTFAISAGLFGPDVASPPAIDLVAFVRFADGRRLFDHNQVAGELDNVRLSPLDGWAADDGGVCAVPPAPEDPRCRDVQQETGIHTEDERMVHLADHCLPYEIAAQHDATHCELYVVGLGDGYVGHYGIPQRWLVGYVRLGWTAGEVLGVGLYAQLHDNATGVAGQRFNLGIPVDATTWKVGIPYLITGFQNMRAVDVTVDAFAFFLDVRRPTGEVVRLWQSRGGQNYGRDEAFAAGSTQESIPYGNIRWALDSSAVFDSYRACR